MQILGVKMEPEGSNYHLLHLRKKWVDKKPSYRLPDSKNTHEHVQHRISALCLLTAKKQCMVWIRTRTVYTKGHSK